MPPHSERHLVTRSAAETLALGERLGRAAHPGDVVALIGDLGTGKTVFTKGIFRGLDGDPREVVSPTFVLMRRLDGRMPLYHFDAYRLRGPGEILEIGAEEAFCGGGLCVVEWADHVTGALPEDRLELHLTGLGLTQREIYLHASGERSSQFLRRFDIEE